MVRWLRYCAVLGILLTATVPANSVAQRSTSASNELNQDQRATARVHINAANELMAQRLWEQALQEYARVYRILDGHAQQHFMLFNMARCYERMSQYRRAIRYYRRYVRESRGQANNVAETRATIERLRQQLTAVRVRADVSEGDVWLDGEQVGTLVQGQTVIQSDPGDHEIEIRATGYANAQRQLSITARQHTQVDFALQPLDSPVHVPWEIIGPGIASTVVGTIVLGLGEAARQQVLETANRGESWSADRGHYEDSQWMLPLGAVLLGAGLIASSVGVVLLLLDGDDADSDAAGSNAAVSLRLAPNGLQLNGRF